MVRSPNPSKSSSTRCLAIRRSLRSLLVLGAFLPVGCNPIESGSMPLVPESSVESNQPVPVVWARGELLPSRRIVRIVATPGDRVVDVLVQPGAKVEKDAPLLKLASEVIREKERDVARQKLQEAKAQVHAKKAEGDLQVSLAELQVKQAKFQADQAKEQYRLADASQSSLELASTQLARYRRLSEDPRTKPMVGTIDVDQRQLEFNEAKLKQQQSLLAAQQLVEASEGAIHAAEEKLNAAKQSRELIDSLVPIQSLEMQMELLDKQLALLRVVAPSQGTILSIGTGVGETIGTLPVMEMADLSAMMCVAEVQETQIRYLKVGQVAKITSGALDRPLQGTIQRINRVVGPHQLKMPNPMAKSDFRAIPVWIEIDARDVEMASQFVQLQVDVAIQTESK